MDVISTNRLGAETEIPSFSFLSEMVRRYPCCLPKMWTIGDMIPSSADRSGHEHLIPSFVGLKEEATPKILQWANIIEFMYSLQRFSYSHMNVLLFRICLRRGSKSEVVF